MVYLRKRELDGRLIFNHSSQRLSIRVNDRLLCFSRWVPCDPLMARNVGHKYQLARSIPKLSGALPCAEEPFWRREVVHDHCPVDLSVGYSRLPRSTFGRVGCILGCRKQGFGGKAAGQCLSKQHSITEPDFCLGRQCQGIRRKAIPVHQSYCESRDQVQPTSRKRRSG